MALQRAIQLDPASTFAYNNLGRVYRAQRKYEEASLQFQNQIAINPDDRYAHANLGAMLRDEKKCGLAIPELQKALSVDLNNADALLNLGDCDIEQGDKARGLSELEQALSVAPNSSALNTAAYILAEHGVELDHAEKWATDAISMQTTQLRTISLEHLAPAQLSLLDGITSYWDTLGWIYFVQGHPEKAETFVRASWLARPDPELGNHLGQILEKLGRNDEAKKTYAMAAAAAEQPGMIESAASADALDAIDEKLSFLAGSISKVRKLVDEGRNAIEDLNTFTLPNPAGVSGNGDFVVKVGKTGISQARRISGDAALDSFIDSFSAAQISSRIPGDTSVELAGRGTLRCVAGQSQCRFVLLSATRARDIALTEMAAKATFSAPVSADDPHIYKNPALGMEVVLPDDWQLLQDDPGNFSRPHNVMFGKSGTLAFVILTREHLESSSDLYRKMLDSGFESREEFSRTVEKDIVQDGISGTRWDMGWKEKGIAYRSILEFFSVGEDHYRVAAVVPSELYERYHENFEDLLRSVKFPMLHTDSKLLNELK